MTSEPVNSISQRECLPTVVSPGREEEGGREGGREERRGRKGEGRREGGRKGGKEGEKREGKLYHYTDYIITFFQYIKQHFR